MNSQSAYPLSWPRAWKRTPVHLRTGAPFFSVSRRTSGSGETFRSWNQRGRRSMEDCAFEITREARWGLDAFSTMNFFMPFRIVVTRVERTESDSAAAANLSRVQETEIYRQEVDNISLLTLAMLLNKTPRVRKGRGGA